MPFMSTRPRSTYVISSTRLAKWTMPSLTSTSPAAAIEHSRAARFSAPPRYPAGLDATSDARTVPYLTGLLRVLGYRVSVHHVRSHVFGAYFGLVQNSANHAQIGGYGWIQDYPAPSDFLDLLFACASFVPNSPNNFNVSEFCDPVLDRIVHRAEAAELTDPTAAKRLWALADRRAVDQAAAVPVLDQIGHDILAPDVQNYQHNAEFGLLIDQLWVR